MMQSGEIRQQFLDFFRSKGHKIVPSAPIVIKNDPSLLFTNAGMNQFKDYFLGNKTPPVSRVADTQKCLRVSGKHNDLEEVGVDTYHHTMFEMLGNWSFGNAITEPAPYFKKEAIAWSWELLTGVFKVGIEDLYVTVFGGDEEEGLPADEESANFWKEWIAEDRIIRGSKKDNFWEMGNTGPCGPCSEIHIDTRSGEEKKKIPGKTLINCDDPHVIEIWNLVFIQFQRKADGSLEKLPSVHVDTGLGFERLVRLLQQKQSNYDTDIFTGTLGLIEKISEKKYTGTQSKKDIAFRVIADHIRAISFPIADGQLPSNTGAGYVIRRILRRAVRYYLSELEVREPLLYKLVPHLANQFQDVFPGLQKQQEFVARVIHEEEQNFLKTLESGLKRLESVMEEGKDIEGAMAFELLDTYGFPIDLTRLIAAEHGVKIDTEGFKNEMQKQKDRSRAAAAVTTGDWIVLDAAHSGTFVGYDSQVVTGKVLRYRKIESQGKESCQIVLDKTPFYAESGGQVGDTGTLLFGNETIRVTNTKKENDLILHFTQKLPKQIEGEVVATIDKEKRNDIRSHHSATHLLHAALRKVLGTHVAQKGSLVNERYLRFDFSHFSKMTDEELREVESIVNEKIRENIPVQIEILDKEKALKKGAMALFGEKYGDKVRVVTMDPKYSIELCGGTHVTGTGALGFFKIISESAIGSGIRRIEAVSGHAAEDYVREELEILKSVRQELKNPKDLPKAVSQLQSEVASQKKQIERATLQQIQSVAQSLLEKKEMVNGVPFIGQHVEVPDSDALRKVCLALEKEEPLLAVLTANFQGKAGVAVVIHEKWVQEKGWDAGKTVKALVSPLIKGGGGGNAKLAVAGGKDTSRLGEVIELVKEEWARGGNGQ